MRMGCQIQVISIHYFLWFGALTSIYGYIGVYAMHYSNASSSQYGLLNSILPFMTIAAKLFFCTMADRRRAHRSFFLMFLIAAMIGYSSFAVLPLFIDPPPKDSKTRLGTWTLICLMTSVSTIALSVICCLSDAFAMNTSRKYNTSFGALRLWGTIGWGASSVVLMFINSTHKLPFLVPGLILTSVLLTTDVIISLYWKAEDFDLESPSNAKADQGSVLRAKDDEIDENKYDTTREVSNLKIQWLLFKRVAQRRKSIFRYMFLFTISGALISLQWSYFFIYLEILYPEGFSVISSLSMIGQSILGELPFFILSDIIIRIIGRSHTLSVSIMSIGVRYLLYNYLLPVSGMYTVLPVEALQGPNFGLFYAVMTEMAMDYSDCDQAVEDLVSSGYVAKKPEKMAELQQALRATMQCLMSACYEGLGVGLGSLIGGFVIDYYGFNRLWVWAAGIAFLTGIMNIAIELIQPPSLLDFPQTEISS